jgi:hypothetical protein
MHCAAEQNNMTVNGARLMMHETEQRGNQMTARAELLGV